MDKLANKGVLFYYKKRSTIDIDYVELTSYKDWKQLKDLQPTTFNTSYHDFVQNNKDQYQNEINNKMVREEKPRPCFWDLSLLENSKNLILSIQNDELFDGWETDSQEKVNIILNM